MTEIPTQWDDEIDELREKLNQNDLENRGVYFERLSLRVHDRDIYLQGYVAAQPKVTLPAEAGLTDPEIHDAELGLSPDLVPGRGAHRRALGRAISDAATAKAAAYYWHDVNTSNQEHQEQLAAKEQRAAGLVAGVQSFRQAHGLKDNMHGHSDCACQACIQLEAALKTTQASQRQEAE